MVGHTAAVVICGIDQYQANFKSVPAFRQFSKLEFIRHLAMKTLKGHNIVFMKTD